MIGFLLIGILLTFSPVLTDVPLKFASIMHDEKQELKIPDILDENVGNVQLFPSENEFEIDTLQQEYLKYLNENEELIFPSESTFRRARKLEKKQCHITVQKTDVLKGTCTKLADNTPACHNSQYLAINFNEC
ncbi:uncharacterized protein TNCT_366901 [Trichonephila clavata]|uniref:Uncharacterized protein n=1 Tax=Trichonephila clavata TaxID=2740835 RepID=A0A8X6GWD1_TRICU|nr:uncharacterized protein TNCT_366901 [Trichonephila clavata]